MKTKKAQTWSADIVIAITMFSFMLILVVYFVGDYQASRVVEKMQSESTKIPGFFSATEDETLNFIDESQVKTEKLIPLYGVSYDEIKQKLGLEYNFCIYFEDEDGNLVYLPGGRSGLGAPDVFVSGNPCSLTSEKTDECERSDGVDPSCADLNLGIVTAAECCTYHALCCL